MLSVLWGLVLLFPSLAVNAFTAVITTTTTTATTATKGSNRLSQSPQLQHFTPSTTTVLHCICINCQRVTNCKAYHFVESKHQQPHINSDPTFEPRNGSPTIHVNIRTSMNTNDTNQQNMDIMDKNNEHSSVYTQQEQEQQEQEPLVSESTVSTTTPSSTFTVNNTVTYEYDVVACADFILDRGAWVRNMPDEIRMANPHFIPT